MSLKRYKDILRKINKNRTKIFLTIITIYPILSLFFYLTNNDIFLEYTSQTIFIGIILILISEVLNETIKSIK